MLLSARFFFGDFAFVPSAVADGTHPRQNARALDAFAETANERAVALAAGFFHFDINHEHLL